MGKDKMFGGPSRFELKLAGQPTKVFNSGYELYNYAAQNNPRMEFEEKQHADRPRNKKQHKSNPQ
jgi:hypothetical protein